MNNCTPQNIQWTANPHYWQKGLAQVKTVNMPAFLSNNTCNEYLATGQAAWGSQFIPNIKTLLRGQEGRQQLLVPAGGQRRRSSRT